jgi:hypothetical protein
MNILYQILTLLCGCEVQAGLLPTLWDGVNVTFSATPQENLKSRTYSSFVCTNSRTNEANDSRASVCLHRSSHVPTLDYGALYLSG